MDVQRPIPNQRLRADWGRAVAEAVRAQGLGGPGVLRTPGGTSLAPPPLPGPAARPVRRPFGARVAAAPGAAAGDPPVLGLTVRPGRVFFVAGGGTAEVPYAASDFATESASGGDEVDGELWTKRSGLPQGVFWVFAEVSFSGGEPTGWTLRCASSLSPSTGARSWPVARCELAAANAAAGLAGGLAVDQLRLGCIVVTPGDGGEGDDDGGCECPYDAGEGNYAPGADTDSEAAQPTSKSVEHNEAGELAVYGFEDQNREYLTGNGTQPDDGLLQDYSLVLRKHGPGSSDGGNHPPEVAYADPMEVHFGQDQSPSATLPWSTGHDALAQSPLTVTVRDLAVAAGAGGSGGVALTVTPTTRTFVVDTRGNVRSVTEAAGSPIQVRNGTDGEDGEDGEDGSDANPEEHWGTGSGTRLNAKPNGATTDAAADWNFRTAGAGRVVTLCNNWLSLDGQKLEAGGRMFLLNRQHVSLYVDSRGNVHRAVAEAMTTHEAKFPPLSAYLKWGKGALLGTAVYEQVNPPSGSIDEGVAKTISLPTNEGVGCHGLAFYFDNVSLEPATTPKHGGVALTIKRQSVKVSVDSHGFVRKAQAWTVSKKELRFPDQTSAGSGKDLTVDVFCGSYWVERSVDRNNLTVTVKVHVGVKELKFKDGLLVGVGGDADRICSLTFSL